LEYWLIRPDEKTIMVFALDKDKKYGRPEVYSHKDTIKSSVFRELEINLQEVLV
jgi:Uma2 family endonuclease